MCRNVPPPVSRAACPLAFVRVACYIARVPYIEPEEYQPDPPLRTQASGPLPWEDPALAWPRRFVSTLGSAFAPLRSIHAVAAGELTPSLTFALLTSLPFMLTWSLVPFTQTLLFKPSFGLELMPSPSMPVWLDLLRAAAIGLVLSFLSALSWILPFASLVSAFSNGTRPENPKLAAWRTALYRNWVIPLGLTSFSLIAWGMPENPSDVIVEIAVISLQLLPRVLLLVHCHTMARYFGASGFGALVVSFIPLSVQWAVSLSLQQAATQLLPAMPPG